MISGESPKEVKAVLTLLSKRPDFFQDPIGREILFFCESGEEFPERRLLRKILQKYIRTHDFKIPDLWHYYLINRFTLSPLAEHRTFYQGYPLPEYLEKEYKDQIILPLKDAFHSLRAPVFTLPHPDLPYLKDRQNLYQAFLTQEVDEIYAAARDYFYEAGPGAISNHYYFEWDGRLIGVGQYRKKRLSELVGYPRQKDMLMENTSRFLNGLEANNAFLYGSRGTGKTSMIQGLLEEYSDRGLRLVKVYREDIEDLPRISRVLKNRKEKFIINLDDISYDEEEFIYKKHKVSIDSFFDRESQNILLYATSNSQEIVKYFRQETTDSMVLDNRSEEEKKLEPPQKQVYDERRAFTERFGLSIFFGRVDSDTGRQILDFYRKKYHVQENLEELEKEYNRWILYHGSVNGRTIENFFKYYYKK
jgi:predicted AAA+ superfamily ATPase